MTKKVNQDLNEERQKITFNVEEFTKWYYGGEANVKDKRYVGKSSVSYTVSGSCNIMLFHYATL